MRRATGALSVLVSVAAVALVALPSSGQRADRPRVFRTSHGGPALQVVARVRTDLLPKSVTISPDGTRAIVCNFGRADHDNVYVYDAMTLERVGVVHFPGNAVEAAFTHDGATLFVSNFQRHVVEVIDFASLTVQAEIAVGLHPKFMVVSPDDRTLYVANYFARTVSVVDLATRTEVRRLDTERHPRGMVVRPDGTLLAAAFHGDVVHVFDEGAEGETARWEMCEMPRHLLLSPDGATMYVTCSMGHVGFYDARSGARLGIAPTGRNPRSIAINGDGRWIGVANFSSHDVSLIDTVDHRHRTYEVPGAHGIVGLAMHPGPSPRIYATSWDTAELIVLGERVAIASHAVEDAPVEAAVAERAPVERAPVERAPVEPAPVEPAPVESAPVDPARVEAALIDAVRAAAASVSHIAVP